MSINKFDDFRLQESYDVESMMEKLHAETSEEPISSSRVSMNQKDHEFSVEPSEQNTNSTRRRHADCVDCDIPFITKKELKVILNIFDL